MQSQLASPKSRSSVKTKIPSSPSSLGTHTSMIEITDPQSSTSESASGFSFKEDRTPHPSRFKGKTSPLSLRKRIDLPDTKSSTVPFTTAKGQFSTPLISRTIVGFGIARDHLSTKLQKLSASERMFVLHIYTWGLSTARYLAAKFHYKLRQPLPVLLEALCELDKNCHGRSATRKRPSNFAAASRRRSSGA